jgi:spore germination protein YaaH
MQVLRILKPAMSLTHSSRPFFRAGAFVLVFAFVLGTPFSALAATASSSSSSKLEVSGWIPYWRAEAGTSDTRKHLSQLTGVNPFGYTVRGDGTLNDAMNVKGATWSKFIKDAKAKKVRVIPTIMWSDGAATHAVLSDPAKRAEHVRQIVDAVEKNNFDGIDIDYEGKRAETRPYFSAFLKELSTELDKKKGNKWLECTIEVRMPLEARYSGTPPAGIEYANHLPDINKYCDRVRVMTYDQQTADVQLNRKHAGQLYAPISDVAWVEKTLKHMMKDIDKRKLVMGIPTYGYIWQVMPNTSGTGFSYIKMEAFNPRYGTQTAAEYGITPTRQASGEMGFSYVPKDNHPSLPSQSQLSAQAPRGTSSANLAAAGALMLAKKERRQAPLIYLTWSDAGAIKQKVDLAKKLGIRGVAVFKFDGGQDAGMWGALK